LVNNVVDAGYKMGLREVVNDDGQYRNEGPAELEKV
jgi:hypothetical protein